MARVTSTEKLPKRIDDYVIYRLDTQFVMRKNSGFTNETILNSTKYARVRENAAEFGHVSRLCKVLRLSLVTLLPKQNNLAVCNALTKLMRQVLVCDTLSNRGERKLALAFENLESKTIVKGYDFNPNSLFKSIFRGSFTYIENGLQFGTFEFNEAVLFPDEADSVGFRLHHFGFDFENGTGNLVSSRWYFFTRNSTSKDFTLTNPNIPSTTGVLFVLLEMQFYTDDCGSFLPCEDGSKVVTILDLNIVSG